MRHGRAARTFFPHRGTERRSVSIILSYLLHTPALIATSILLAALLLARTFSGQPLMNGENMRLAREQLPVLQEQIEGGTFDTAPDMLRDSLAKELSVLQALAKTASVRDRARAYSQYLSIEERLIELGYLQSGDDASASLASMQAERAFYESLASLDDPQVYETPLEEPLLVSLCDGALAIPALLWHLPSLVAVAACASLRERGRALAQTPCLCREVLAEIAATCLASLLATGCSTIPSCLVAIRNGLGDPTYPVVYLWGGEIVGDTVGKALGEAILLQAIGTLLVTSFGELASLLAAKVRLGSLVASGSLLCCSSVFMLTVPPGATTTIPSLLPFSYLLVNLYAQRPQSAYFLDMQPLAGASFFRGLAVQTTCATALLALIILVATRMVKRG